jgi:hypothetical protein
MFERQQRRSTLARRQIRFKRMRATAAVAAVGACSLLTAAYPQIAAVLGGCC